MDKAEFERLVKEYLKENLRVDVSTDDKSGDFGYGDYRDYKTHTIIISLGNEEICETKFDTGG